MFDLGTKEIIILAAVLLLLFGSGRIPALAKNLVQAVKELKNVFKS